MKISAISDIHGNLNAKIEPCDVLIIAGDICPSENHTFDYQKKWNDIYFMPWAENLLKDVGNIVFIAGNHDTYYEALYYSGGQKEKRAMFSMHENIHYLRDSMVNINGVSFYGTPWSKTFYDWAWMLDEFKLDDKFKKIPEGIDFLISHSPPYGNNDTIGEYYAHPITGEKLYRQGLEHLGSTSLAKHIKRANPKWNICGHIHTGNHSAEEVVCDNNEITKVVNVSLLDERYRPFSVPYIIEK
jgi:Icc-related predicted phosphoesterase